jgi:hypothetical protein
VEAAEHGGEGVWVSQSPGAVLILGAQPVGEARGPIGQQALEEAVPGAALQRCEGCSGQIQHSEPGCSRDEGADHQSGRRFVRAEYGERVGVPGGQDGSDVGF